MGLFSGIAKAFGGSSSVSSADARTIVLKACDLVRDAKGAGPSLRRVLADACSPGTSPDSSRITSVLNEIRKYGGLPEGVEPTSWWENATKSDRIGALSSAAECLK